MGLFNNPRPSIALGDRMTKWPGYSLPDTGSFQFDEHEFMKPEDYDAFLADPSDWTLRKILVVLLLAVCRAAVFSKEVACRHVEGYSVGLLEVQCVRNALRALGQ
jgi:hypothetical protein